MQIYWTSGARKNLVDLEAYISHDNPQAAVDLIDRIFGLVELLAEHPEIGRPGRIFGTRELVVPSSAYIVPYRLKNNTIQILRVLHASRKWPEDL